MRLSEREISELLCTKLCHDLAGPVGAVNNGIDFFESDNIQMRAKAFELVHLSARQAVNRLTFFRQAYGVVAQSSEINISEVKSLVLRFIEDTKLKLDFPDSEIDNSDVLDGRMAKLLLNFVIISGYILMYNGLISVKIYREGKKLVTRLSLDGESCKIEDELANILDGNLKGIEINSRNIQHYYTRLLLDEVSASLDVIDEKDKLSFIVAFEKHK